MVKRLSKVRVRTRWQRRVERKTNTPLPFSISQPKDKSLFVSIGKSSYSRRQRWSLRESTALIALWTAQLPFFSSSTDYRTSHSVLYGLDSYFFSCWLPWNTDIGKLLNTPALMENKQWSLMTHPVSVRSSKHVSYVISEILLRGVGSVYFSLLMQKYDRRSPVNSVSDFEVKKNKSRTLMRMMKEIRSQSSYGRVHTRK